MTMLPITLTIAGAAVLINIWLALRVSQLRLRHKVSIGDAGNDRVACRMRAHANFIEYTPLFLILLAAIELAHGSETWLWGASIVYIIGRLMHPFGMDRPAPNPFRMGGILITWIVLLGLAAYAVSIPYLGRAAPIDTSYAAAPPNSDDA